MINSDCFRDAADFIDSLDDGACLPDVILSDDYHEFMMLWKFDGLYIDLGFSGDGTYSYYGRNKNGDRFLRDDVPVGTPLPVDLIADLIEEVDPDVAKIDKQLKNRRDSRIEEAKSRIKGYENDNEYDP